MTKATQLLLAAGLGFLLAAFALPTVSRAQQAEHEWEDIIVERDEKGGKREITGSITKESYDKITYIMPETDGTASGGVPTLRVVEVQYDPQSKSPDFSRAEAAYNAGNWRGAIDLFKKSLKARDLRPIFRQQARYKLAVCYENLGAYDEASKAYQELLAEFPDSRYLREAHEGIVNCLLASGKVDDALKAVADAEKAVRPLRLEAAFMRKLDFLKGRIYEEKKSYGDAIRQYQLAAADKTLEVAGEASLGIARCKLKEGKLQDAEDAYRRIAAEFKGAQMDYIKAGAWNGVGDICLKRAEAIPGVPPEKVRLFEEALWAYLRGVIQWDKVKVGGKWTGKVDEFARAMYFAAWCFDRLKDAYKEDKAKRDTYRMRAQQLYSEAASEFPTTRWGQEAKKGIK